MARILGLDLGSHTLKGVVIEANMRSAAVKAVASVRLPTEGEKAERYGKALATLMAQAGLAADTVVVALPGLGLATHQLTLPFSDPKRIEATLGFEVESQLPFDLSDAVFDYQVGSADEKGSQLLVGVARKEEVSSLLELLKSSKLEPRIVTHPALTYGNLFATLPANYLPQDPRGAVAILDIGHERTCIAIGRPGESVEAARTFAGGGASLTRALAQEFKITPAEAEAWKEQHGALGEAAVGDDAERASGAFLRGLQPILRELRPTLKSFAAKTHRPIERVILCGGTALLPGLDKQLEKDLGVEVVLLKVPGEIRETAGSSGLAAAQAWALALRGSSSGAKAPRFNLRRGEFAFKSDFDFAKEKLGQLVTFAVVLLVLLIAGGVVRNTVLERREKQLDGMLCDITQRVLGKCEPDMNKARNLMQGKESPAAVLPKRSAVTLLAELSQRIPETLNVTMDQVVIAPDRVAVRCEAANSKAVEDLITALKSYKCFKEITEGKVEKNKDGTKVSFRLDIQVDCPDAAAPQG